jgi:hypothetical protein
LEKFKATHKKGFHMVHCWDKLKEAMKWIVSYAAYQEAIKNGTTTVVVDVEDDEPGHNALPPRPQGHKFTKADLAREALALALSHAL